MTGDRFWLDWSLEKRAYWLIVCLFLMVVLLFGYAVYAVTDRNTDLASEAERQAERNEELLKFIRQEFQDHRCNTHHAWNMHDPTYAPVEPPEECPASIGGGP